LIKNITQGSWNFWIERCEMRRLVILAGDIGGTKTNLGFFVLEGDSFRPKKVRNFHNAEYPEFTSILKEFLEVNPGEIKGACFGIAGPVINGVCKTTNLPWVVDTSKLKVLLRIKDVSLINDMEATAYGIQALPKTALAVLNHGKAVPQGNIAVIAAGTGLGEGMLIWDGHHYRAVASEGGHSDFAPCNNLELDLCKYLLKKFGHSSYERVLSGPGLLNIYDFLKTRNFAREPDWLKKEMKEENPSSVITKNALKGRNKLCEKSLDLFCAIYGAEAGNLALKVLGLGGVYLGGGIAPKIISKLQNGVFRKAFLEKGRFSKFLSKIPVYAILEEKTALHGAAVYALQLKLKGEL
jgi:glucokinase